MSQGQLDANAFGVVAALVDELSGYSAFDQATPARTLPSSAQHRALELESVLANTSFAHEYALIQLNQTADERERDSLFIELENCHDAYEIARRELDAIDKNRVRRFEAELMWQKNSFLRGYTV